MYFNTLIITIINFRTDWRKLRNQFLNMQRQKMSLLKAQLRRPIKITNSNTNFYENTDNIDEQFENVETQKPLNTDIRVKYEPGVILKILFSNPIECDKVFKVIYIFLY